MYATNVWYEICGIERINRFCRLTHSPLIVSGKMCFSSAYRGHLNPDNSHNSARVYAQNSISSRTVGVNLADVWRNSFRNTIVFYLPISSNFW